MRYAICNETFADWPLERACAEAAAAGYAGLEVAPFTLGDRPVALSAGERARIAATIRAAGLECVGLHLLLARTEGLHVTHPDRAVRAATVAHLGELARLCRDLGGRVLVFGSPKQRSLLPGTAPADAIDRLAAVFAELVPVLEETGTVVALEPLAPSETDVLTTAAETVAVVTRIGSPHVRLHLDVKAMSSERRPIPAIIAASAPHLEHFHANDANLRGPGFGTVDFGPIFAALEAAAYRGWVSVEVFDYAPGPERACRESIAYMRGVEAGLAARRPGPASAV
ncbi:MAG: sugar phosphate isomerase/epimerase family protein [Planctomycetaceae bacterium]